MDPANRQAATQLLTAAAAAFQAGDNGSSTAAMVQLQQYKGRSADLAEICIDAINAGLGFPTDTPTPTIAPNPHLCFAALKTLLFISSRDYFSWSDESRATGTVSVGVNLMNTIARLFLASESKALVIMSRTGYALTGVASSLAQLWCVLSKYELAVQLTKSQEGQVEDGSLPQVNMEQLQPLIPSLTAIANLLSTANVSPVEGGNGGWRSAALDCDTPEEDRQKAGARAIFLCHITFIITLIEEYGMMTAGSKARGLTATAHEACRLGFLKHIFPIFFQRTVEIFCGRLAALTAVGATISGNNVEAAVSQLFAKRLMIDTAIVQLLLSLLSWPTNTLSEFRSLAMAAEDVDDKGRRILPEMKVVRHTSAIVSACVSVPPIATQIGIPTMSMVVAVSTWMRCMVSPWAPWAFSQSGTLSPSLRVPHFDASLKVCWSLLIQTSSLSSRDWSDQDACYWATLCLNMTLDPSVATIVMNHAAALASDGNMQADANTARLEYFGNVASAISRIFAAIDPQKLFLNPTLHTVLITPLEQLTLEVNKVTGQLALDRVNAVNQMVAAGRQIDLDLTEETDEEAQWNETLEHLLSLWETLMAVGVRNVTTKAMILGTPVLATLQTSGYTIFHAFVTARVHQIYMGTSSGKDKKMLLVGPAAVAAGMEPSPGRESYCLAGHDEEYTAAQIRSIGILGREKPGETATKIAELMQTLLQMLGPHLVPGASGNTIAVSEALWYVVSILRAFLADESPSHASDATAVPEQFISEALRLGREARAAQPNASQEQIDAMVEGAHGAFKLITLVINVAMTLVGGASGSMLSKLSPSVTTVFLDTFLGVCAAYLVPDVELYADFSPVFTSAFGNGLQLATAATTFAVTALDVCKFDDGVTHAAAMTLLTIVSRRGVGTFVATQHPSTPHLLQVATSGGFSAKSQGAILAVIASALTEAHKSEVSQGVASGTSTAQLTATFSGILQKWCNEIDQATMHVDGYLYAATAMTTLFETLRRPEAFSTVTTFTAALIDRLSRYSVHNTGHGKGPDLKLLAQVLIMLDTVVRSALSVLSRVAIVWMIEIAIDVVEAAMTAVKRNRDEWKATMVRTGGGLAPAQRQLAEREEENCVMVLVAVGTLIKSASTEVFIDMSGTIDFGEQSASGEAYFVSLLQQRAAATNTTPAVMSMDETYQYSSATCAQAALTAISVGLEPSHASTLQLNDLQVERLAIRGLFQLLTVVNENSNLLWMPQLSHVTFKALELVSSNHTKWFTRNARMFSVLLSATLYALTVSTDTEVSMCGFATIDSVVRYFIAHHQQQAMQQQNAAAQQQQYGGTRGAVQVVVTPGLTFAEFQPTAFSMATVCLQVLMGTTNLAIQAAQQQQQDVTQRPSGAAGSPGNMGPTLINSSLVPSLSQALFSLTLCLGAPTIQAIFAQQMQLRLANYPAWIQQSATQRITSAFDKMMGQFSASVTGMEPMGARRRLARLFTTAVEQVAVMISGLLVA